MAYVSIVLALRNDDYGGELIPRIDRFVSHLVTNLGDGSDGIYELVVVDWNPPGNRPPIRAAVDWSFVQNIKHIEVSASVHEFLRMKAKIKRNMYDYIARAIGAHEATSDFVAITNQDVLWSGAIFSHIRMKMLREDCFYRADRLDTSPRDFNASTSDAELLRSVVQVQRRHARDAPLCAVLTAPTDIGMVSSQRTWGNPRQKVEIGPKRGDRRLKRMLRSTNQSMAVEEVLSKLGLHTNASGDFLIAPRSALVNTSPCLESLEFYLHLDAYWICKLWSLGFRQALFLDPGYVFHIGHGITDHLASEQLDWNWHRQTLLDLLMRADSVSSSQSFIADLQKKRTVVFTNDTEWSVAPLRE